MTCQTPLQAVVTVGISASGKSTHAKELVEVYNYKEVNRDTIRRSLMEVNGGTFSWDKWNWKREKEVTKIANEMIATIFKQGYDIVVSDTHLNEDRRNHVIEILVGYGYIVTVKEFEVTLEEAWKRDARRSDGVGHSVIAKQHEQWLEHVGQPHKYVCADDRFTKCILVDIDGTLAHMNGKRGAFEWHNVGRDDVDEHVKTLVNLMPITTMVIVMSGRDSVCRPETEKWLEDNFIHYDHLFMRAEGDMRKDTLVKFDLFNAHIRDGYNVQFVIDDRPSVCRMWRDVLGLKVFQVGNQSIEF